jgi:hypothetical protein
MIHEDAAHHLGGDAEKVRAVLPADTALRHQSHIGFVDNGRRLEGVAGPLTPEITGGQSAQFTLHHHHQLFLRLGRSLAPLAQQNRHFIGVVVFHGGAAC